MTITDLTSMATAQQEQQKEINQRLKKLQNEISDYCYQCAKCTAGCEAHKLLELEPHKIVALLKRGLIDEMTNSDVIWTCMTCFKCYERCPQKIAPIEILIALKNIAVLKGKQLPGQYTQMLQSILTNGHIQDIQETTTKDGKTIKRSDLHLPPLTTPTDLPKFQTILSQLAIEKI